MNQILAAIVSQGNGIGYLLTTFASSPMLCLNYIAQAYFFSMSATSFITIILTILRIRLASAIMKTTLARIAVFVIFLYIKLWGIWTDFFLALSYICLFFMMAYVYDCCYNIADFYNEKVYGYYFWQVGLYVGILLLFPVYWIFAKFSRYPQNSLIILIGQLCIIGLYNALKMKHIIYTITIGFTMIGTVLIRIYSTEISSFDNYILCLPIEMVPLSLMAFQAEHRQNFNEIYKQLLIFAVTFIIFTLFNCQPLYIEHMLFVVWITGQVIPKNRQK